MSVNNREWTVTEIKSLLKTNDKMVIRSLFKLYDYQTYDEKESKESSYNNGVGFNKYDASYLTSIVERYKQGNRVTYKEFCEARRRLIKYSNQLAKIANGVI